MEIIKEGKLPEKFMASCPDCDTIVTFSRDEIKHSLFGLGPDYVKCPKCGGEIAKMFWNKKDDE